MLSPRKFFLRLEHVQGVLQYKPDVSLKVGWVQGLSAKLHRSGVQA